MAPHNLTKYVIVIAGLCLASMVYAQPSSQKISQRSAKCSDMQIDGQIHLSSKHTTLIGALRNLNRGSAKRESSDERRAVQLLADLITADGMIDSIEKELLCEMTDPERSSQIAIYVDQKQSHKIWAHRGYTEQTLLRVLVNGAERTQYYATAIGPIAD